MTLSQSALRAATSILLLHSVAHAQTPTSAPASVPAAASAATPPAASAPQILDVQGGHIRVVTVASGLVHPWSLAFLPDGKTLLVAEAGRLRVIRGDALDPEPAWTVPKDNPFVGRADARPEIFTYGHRNGYGLAFNPETGVLWQAEIGPLGGDEVNVLIAGHDYGWPLVSMGRNYTGSLVSEQWYHRDGMDDPRMFWVPSISPSSLAFYTGDKFPRWKGSMLVGALNGQSLQRVSFNQPSQAERREPLLRQLGVRIRDVQQSPDGYLYVATEQRSGGTAADGTVLRLEPVDGF